LSTKWLFALVGVLAALAGSALWLATRPAVPTLESASGVSPAAVMAASFRDLEGRPRSLGEFQGKAVVLNFWATWCAPCREEMPAFERLQAKWRGRGVQFVGVSAEDAPRVADFAKRLGVTYPLWVGGDEVSELSRRLGNRMGVLPHTVVLDRRQTIVAARVGAYPEEALDSTLDAISPNAAEK
jgi:thiol-disulfide isomerase/thioredoxin